jgi:predicted alpha/beta hydrolase
MAARARRSEAPPGDGAEAIEIHTSDGRALRATVREPARGAKARGVVVLAHAMFARRSEWDKAGFARFLTERGWRTIAFDFRGHGDSGPGAATGADWTYDDLALVDLPAVVAGARARARARDRIVVVGHSLGGHVAVASQATGAMAADGIALVASNMWLREIEPSGARWLAKLAIARAMDEVRVRRGYFPARALRQGSDDESPSYVAALTRVVVRASWRSEDGRVDYWDEMRRMHTPLYALASDGDPINAHPECAARFALRAPGRVTFDRIARSDDGGSPPGHMEVVTTARSASAWGRLERWMAAL